MSGYTVLGGNLQTKYTKITTTSATTVLDAGPSGATVVAIYACEISGSTPTLSIDRFDGTTATFVRPTKALTAREEIVKDVLLVLKANELLRATASAGNQVDVIVTYSPRDATAKGGSMGTGGGM